MWRQTFCDVGIKGTLKPESGENIKEKLSGKPASILDTTITLEEFEVYNS